MRMTVPLLVQGISMLAAPSPAWTQPAAAPAAPATSPAPPPGPAVVGEPAGKSPRPVLLPGETQFNECLRLPRNGRFKVTLKPDSEITDVIAWISSATCKGFIVAQGLQLAGRKVTVFSPEDLSAPEAYRLFLALLESAGLTAEPNGRFLRIIEASKSPRALLPIFPAGEAPARHDGYVTRVVRVKHASVTELAAILQSYRGESGAISAYPPAGTLLLTDRAATLDRLVALIAALDVPGEELRLWTLPARHLSAVELAQTLSELAGLPASAGAASSRRGAGPAPATPAPATPNTSGVARLQPDDRAGRLLVVATDAAFARLAALAAQLDVPAETRAAKVHAYRCRHADCDAVSAILATLADIQVSRGPNPDGARSRGAAPALPPSVAAPPASAAPRVGSAPLFGGEVRVTSDPTTNALLVMASLDDFRTLRRLIEEIDVPRKQVFIEATIMEVLRRKDRQIGVSYHGGRLAGQSGAVVGGFNAARTLLLDESTLGSALVGLSGLAVGAPLTGLATALGLPAGSIPSLGAFIQLLQDNENVDLIANPHLLITNNHEGEISVGQVVPVPGAFTQSVNGAQIAGLVPSVSVNREKVALTLKLTPHVNEDGLIRLEIEQEMSELGATGALGPSTTQRTTHTTVFARDQQTIVIGGLMRERQTDSVQKVPLLGDIPLLGVLFRSTQKVVEKQNIILALTPYVIDEPADLTRVLEAKLRDRRELARLYDSDEEQRLRMGPLGMPKTPGMLERIHRAVQTTEEGGPDATPPPASPPSPQTEAQVDPGATGLPLPGS
jgi:general secretion pathway protein D